MVLTSPFFHTSIIIALLLAPAWSHGSIQENALTVIPSMLGFSLVAFAFSLGIGTDKFKLILGARRAGDKPSLVDGLSTAFVHFLFVQIFALLINLLLGAHWVAFLLKTAGASWEHVPGALQVFVIVLKFLFDGFAAFLFIYAMLSVIPAVLHIYMAAKLFEKFSSKYVRPGKGLESGGAGNRDEAN